MLKVAETPRKAFSLLPCVVCEFGSELLTFIVPRAAEMAVHYERRADDDDRGRHFTASRPITS